MAKKEAEKKEVEKEEMEEQENIISKSGNVKFTEA